VPSGKGIIAVQLGIAAREMLRASGPLVREVAVECGFGMVEDIEQQKQRLWHRLLPAVPYRDPAVIIADMEIRIAAGLQQFMEQWKAWDSGDEGATPERLGEEINKRSLFEKLFGPQPDAFVILWQLRQQWKAEHPFKPNLRY
jgi:hypothetical protein